MLFKRVNKAKLYQKIQKSFHFISNSTNTFQGVLYPEKNPLQSSISLYLNKVPENVPEICVTTEL